MFAEVGEIADHVQVKVGAMPSDPARVIDSAAFLNALRGGPPAAERAFRDLFLHLRAPLIRFLRRWIRETEAIEDLVQETFLAVHEGLGALAVNSGLAAWVYSLAYEKAMNLLQEKYGTTHETGNHDEQIREVAAADPGPDEATHQSLLVAVVRSASDMIPEHYRVVWRLCDVETMSGEEASEALGIAHTLVRVRLHRARGLIADRLRKERPGLFRKSVSPDHRSRELGAQSSTARWRRR